MVRFTGGLLLFTAYAATISAANSNGQQQVLQQPNSANAQRKLQGRFLHITDVHPDPFYKAHSKTDGDHPCHGKAGKGGAGYYGAAMTECDTPFTLVNATFDWIEENIKDKIDFVIWTGDSARHDNDERLPRNNKQISDLNRYVVDQFVRVFGKTGEIDPKNPTDSFVVPIVPTYGNNDILPHNIFTTGPNHWTREFEEIWRGFIPQEQKHSFARGGWFFSEVIPNRLAVFSLNSIYFFDSNSAVDGCDAKSEPGYEHMEWLRIQLQFLRERGMKAVLIGHVPPARTGSKQSWDETCYQKYTLWLRQYRDVIVANIFGHMNVDHFMFQDVAHLKYKFDIDGIDDDLRTHDQDQPVFTTGAKKAYLNELHDDWSDLPTPPKGASYNSANATDALESMKHKKRKKKGRKQRAINQFYKKIGGPYGERYSLTMVSPSIVPNFFPTLRIMEYNITGMEHDHPASHAMGIPAEFFMQDVDDATEDQFDLEPSERELRRRSGDDMEIEKKKKKKHKKKPAKPDFPVPLPPSSTAPPGPGYSPQTLSLLGYSQLYANLTEINKAFEHSVKSVGLEKAKKGSYVEFKPEYETFHDKHYKLHDLTMMSYLHLAERIGREELRHGDFGADSDPDDLTLFDEEEINITDSDLLDSKLTDDNDSDLEDNEDVDVESDNEDDDNVDVDTTKKRKKKKHCKKRKNKKDCKMKNHLWKEFLRRAYVHTMTDEELDETFGT